MDDRGLEPISVSQPVLGSRWDWFEGIKELESDHLEEKGRDLEREGWGWGYLDF